MSYPMDLDDHATEVGRLQREAFGELNLNVQGNVLSEEVGEVCRVLAKSAQGIRVTDRGDLTEEIGDVLFVLLGIASMTGINPGHALRAAKRKLRDRIKSGHYERGEGQ